MITLPDGFAARMQKLLGEEYPAFLSGYERELSPSLRINTEKITVENFQQLSPFSLRPIPWVPTGFYYEPGERPGKHPYHDAGLYYIQEASAMSVAELADPIPGERVLDLCAAPGGKTTQLAAKMQGKGVLVANEIHPSRAKILSQNVERMGISNAVVTSEDPDSLARHFPEWFDRIVVDAPCSGEGMFRKEEHAQEHWSQENIDLCAERQKDILEAAARMLRPGGTLIYSTCTFAPEEDEGSVATFLRNHPDFFVQRIEQEKSKFFAKGRPLWADAPMEVENTFRLWPHLLEGEGHYVAVLTRKGEDTGEREKRKNLSPDKEKLKLWKEFAKENLRKVPQGELISFGDQIYLMPEAISLRGCKVLRPGLHVGTCRKNRLEPAHALALSLKAQDAVHRISLHVREAEKYLRGETLGLEAENGWTLVCVDGYSLGWGKVTGGILKNHYPKGLRHG